MRKLFFHDVRSVVHVAFAVSALAATGHCGPLASETVALQMRELRTPIFESPNPGPPLPAGMWASEDQGAVGNNRLAVWSGLVAGAGYLAYEQSQASWGASSGKFHFKDDLNDGLAMSDEASHLFAAYQLTRALHAGYSWTGMSPTASRRFAAAHAWLWTFLVEYPIDAYNPSQGFGVSDLAFNTVGVFAAYRQTRPWPSPCWDVKISLKRSFFDGERRVIAQANEQYDDYIYWFTIRPIRDRYVPLRLGVGYATTHGEDLHVDKELHLGIGTSLKELGALIDEKVGSYLAPLDFLFLNVGTKIIWR